MENTLMKTPEVITKTGLSRNTIYRMLERKEVPEHCVQQAAKGRTYLFIRAAVDYFVSHARWPSSEKELDQWRRAERRADHAA